MSKTSIDDVDLDTPEHILANIAEKSQNLDLEIIDFLLAWEETESDNTSVANSSGFRLKDDGLEALERVDQELKCVDDWIGEQMTRLQDIKKKLNVIDIESNSLETTWSNLAALRESLDYSIDRLTIQTSQEQTLQQPQLALDSILKSSDPFTAASNKLAPLEKACASLSNALKSNYEPTTTIEASSPTGTRSSDTTKNPSHVFHMLSNLSAFTTRRENLRMIGNRFCKTITEKLPQFFESLFDHNNMPEMTINNENKRMKSVTQLDCIQYGIECLVESYDDSMNYEHTTMNDISYQGTIMIKNYEAIQISTNVLSTNKIIWLKEQQFCHEMMSSYIPIFHYIYEFHPHLYKNFIQHHIKDCWKTRVYGPLLKSLGKSLKASNNTKTTTNNNNLSSMPIFSLSSKRLPFNIKHFQKGDNESSLASSASTTAAAVSSSSTTTTTTTAPLTPSLTFAVLLSLVIQLYQNEETYLMKLLFFPESEEETETLLQQQQQRDQLYHLNSKKNTTNGADDDDDDDDSDDEDEDDDYKNALYDKDDFHNIIEKKRILKDMIYTLFDYFTADRILKILFHSSSNAMTSLVAQEYDGMITISIMATLEKFIIDNNLTILFMDKYDSTSSGISGGGGGGGNSGLNTFLSPSKGSSISTQISDNFIYTFIHTCQKALDNIIDKFIVEQITWITQQKADPKKGIGLPVLKIPSFLSQIIYLYGNQKTDSIMIIIDRLLSSIFDWIESLAAQNRKYTDLVKIYNYGFLRDSLLRINIHSYFNMYIDTMNQVLSYCESNYVIWMVDYEFPILANLSKRLNSVSVAVDDEEISLYIKRKDVLSVHHEVEGQKYDDHIINIRSRIQKHFLSVDLQGMNLLPKFWNAIIANLDMTLNRVNVAAVYFQIQRERESIQSCLKKLSKVKLQDSATNL